MADVCGGMTATQICCGALVIILYALSWYLWFLFFFKDKIPWLLFTTVVFVIIFYYIGFDPRGLIIYLLFTINSIFWLFNEE